MPNVRTPWVKNLGDVPESLDYFKGTMFEAVENIAEKYPGNVAFDYMGESTSYTEFVGKIDRCAKALKAIGICAGERVTICMPNAPQAVITVSYTHLTLPTN